MFYDVGYAVILSVVPVLLVNAGFSMEHAGASAAAKLDGQLSFV